jgi:PPOX class probable F420-dependent enzyme
MDLGDARYVSLTTYRRSGEAVPVPVWIAPLGDGRLGFTTDPTSGKVKRLRANPEVTLRECSMRGEVAAGTAEVLGTAEVVASGPDRELVERAIGAKYGLQFTLVELGGKLKRMVTRSGDAPTAVVITTR